MKNILFISVVLVLLSSCGNKINENYYKSESEGFAILPPENWEIIKNFNDFIPVSFVSPRENDLDIFIENIEVIRTLQEKKLKPEEYHQLHMETMQSKFPDYKVIDSGTNKDASEKNYRTINTYTIDGLRFKCVTYYFTNKEKGFVVNCTTNPESFDKYRPVFEEICSTFTFFK